MTDADRSALRRQVAGWLSGLAADIGDSGFRDHLNRAVEAAIMAPGSITVTAAPPEPVPVAVLKLLVQLAPESLPGLLGLTIEGAARQAP